MAIWSKGGDTTNKLIHEFTVGDDYLYDRVLAPYDCYGGTHRLLSAWHRTGRIEAEFVDFTDFTAVARALEPGPRLVWIETPSNPLLRITDLAAASDIAHQHGVVAAQRFQRFGRRSRIERRGDSCALIQARRRARSRRRR